jgi:hypothetical protein
LSLATRPLLRQIENLQATYISQINSLEKTERQLTDRLGKLMKKFKKKKYFIRILFS